MTTFSTRQAAKKLGIDMSTLLRHIRLGKVPAPKSATSGGMTIHFWTEKEIEHIRELLPKIANGRKTRHQKQSASSTQRSEKSKGKKKAKKKIPARVPVPHKQGKTQNKEVRPKL